MPDSQVQAAVYDTDVASRSFKGRLPAALAARLVGRQPLVTFVTVGELTQCAIEKAAHLIRALSAADLPGPASPEFPLPGKLTVTAIEGGQGYSVTPDLCTLNVDIRTTPDFDDHGAADFLARIVGELDDTWPGTRPTGIQPGTRWPAYVLPEDSRLRRALLDAGQECGVPLETKIAGPSNIGNYLAGLGIAATAGFGVDYVGLHGTDERIRLDTVPAVQAVYHNAVLRLLVGVN